MVKTASTMLQLGAPLPAFELPDVTTGDLVTPADVTKDKGLLVMFICRHCPFVVHVKKGIAKLAKDYLDSEIGIVAISANDVADYPDDAPDNLAAMARELGFGFPYLYDETQETAKAFFAACTPDFFLFDGEGKLAYRGQMDDSRPGNDRPNDGRDLRAAMDHLIAGAPVPLDQKPSLGCNIKWKPGNAPDYF
jgi:thiol-disulfide isomerase/thioredoxin